MSPLEVHKAAHPVDRIAYAIGKVIARKTIHADPGLRRLDALGQASAAHTMATNMVPQLQLEAEAAWAEAQALLTDQAAT